MPLDPGSRLGPYEIVAQLGQGGMGVVFRARDTRLEREVAVKVLPKNLADDPDALSRFEREAKAVAALSHPNILAIHDFGREQGTAYAAMELLEGETLRERLREGALPARKAVELALEIADALAAAHEKGVVHRDLKPENVFLLRSGQVKVLDFGLARIDPVAPDGQGVATVSLSTEPGRVMGTVGYMAPEQVRGQPIDARADLFSFGAVLYEMLTGTRAFHGASPVETLNAILKEDPPGLFESARNVSPALERIVRRCLEKRPEERFRTAHDLGIALDAISTSSTRSMAAQGLLAGEARFAAARARLFERLVLLLAGGVLASLAWLGWGGLRGDEAPGAAVFHWLSFSGRDSSPAVSPDGRTIAFVSGRDGRQRIWLKQADGEGEAALTEGPDDFPRFAPDGGQVLFARSGAEGSSLYRAAVLGGEARRLVEGASEGDFTPDGERLVFLRLLSEGGQTLTQVSVAAADGSDPRELCRLPGGLRGPRVAPDGRVLALVPMPGGLAPGTRQGVVLVHLEDGSARTAEAPDARRNISTAAWTRSGELVYLQAESIVTAAGSAARLVRQDAGSGRVRAEIWSPANALVLDVVGDGRVVFDTRSPRQNLREVKIRPAGEGGRWLSRGESTDRQPVYSPDGEWVAFSSNRGGGMNLWLVSTRTGRLRRVTESHVNWDPAFTRDGRQLLWSSSRGGNLEIWVADVDGGALRQLSRDGHAAENPTATPDGWVVHSSSHAEKAGLWKLQLDGSGATRIVAGRVSLPEVSPDGRHVLYRVFSGKYPALVRVARVADGQLEPFEIAVEARKRTTVTLGRARWMPDGRAIAFIGQDEGGASGVYVQDFAPGRDTRATRRKLAGFDPDVAAESFGIAPDGSRLVLAGWVQLFSLMEGEGLPGLAPPGGGRGER